MKEKEAKNSKTASKYGKQVICSNREIQMVRLGLMKVSSQSQRELRPAWVDDILSTFDLEKLGTPEVSRRDGYYYIIDGQHRYESLKLWLGKGWEEQHIQCWVHEGMNEESEAEAFLGLNHRKVVNVFQEFKVAVVAGRSDETEINRIVNEEGLVISQNAIPGGVGCVGTLKKSHRQHGAEALRRALRLASASYGDSGMEAIVIDGLSMLCHRYNGVLDERTSVDSLAQAKGGVNGLTGQAEQLRLKTGCSKAQCVAAAAVNIINRDRKTGSKLQPWFKDEK